MENETRLHTWEKSLVFRDYSDRTKMLFFSKVVSADYQRDVIRKETFVKVKAFSRATPLHGTDAGLFLPG